MANLIYRNMIIDSQRHAVIHILIQSDGSGELVNQTLIDPVVDFQPAATQPIYLGLEEFWIDTSFASGSTFTGLLQFDAPTPMPIWPVSQALGDTHHDFRCFGGIKDKTGIDGTGKLTISTTGFRDPAASIGMILKVKKFYKPVSQYPVDTLGVADSDRSVIVPMFNQ